MRGRMSLEKNTHGADTEKISPPFARSLAEHWQRAAMDVQPANKFIWLTLAVLLVFVAFGYITYHAVSQQFQEIGNERMRVRHSRDVLNSIVNIRDLVQAGATGTRLYVTTGEEPYLRPHQDMLQQYPRQLQQLQALLNNDIERRDFAQLKILADAVVTSSVDWRQTYRQNSRKIFNQSQWVSSNGAAVVAMRQFVAKWQEREAANLYSGDARTAERLVLTRRYALGALLAVGTLVLFLGWLLRAYMLRRQQMEAGLRITSNLWSGTLESLDQGVGLYTMDRRLLLWNSRFPEIHGVPAEKLYPGISAETLIRESQRLQGRDVEGDIAAANNTAELIRSGYTPMFEHQRADGTMIQICARAMGDDYYVLTISDITSIRHSERLARERATRLSAVLDNVPDGIVTINPSGSIESWSEGAQRMFGYTTEEIQRRHVQLLFAEPFATARDGYLQRCLAGDTALMNSRVELEARRKDGGEFPIDLSISQMQIEDRRVLVAILRDISERRMVERMKGEFVATVSHELRTPLTSIAGSLALLASGAGGELPDKAQRFLDIANRNSQRLTVLINDILELEKAESGKLSLELQKRALMPVIHQAIEANRAYGERFDIQFSLRSNDDPMVLIDELRIMQVLANLLSNAVKFSPPGAEVLIVVERNEEVVRVTVHDDGPGVADNFRDRVFARFAQADNSNTRRSGGTGLGLAITKSLIEHHGGTIGFDSGQSLAGRGQGASFWFQLPLLPTHEQADGDLNVAVFAHARILICDDDPDIAELLSKLLQQYGGSIDVVHSAAAAQEALHRYAPDLLIVDMNLPDTDGLTLIAQVRAQLKSRDVPVMILSAIDCADLDASALHALGVKGCLRKPVDAPVLVRNLVRLLERQAE